MKKILLFWLVAFLFTVSCTPKANDEIDKDLFAQITAKILIIQYTNLPQQQKAIFVRHLLNKYELTSHDFLMVKERHAADPYYWEEVYGKINKILENVDIKKIDEFLELMSSR
ncbi:hypothetical protein ACX8XP_02105 [Calditrichota bacterium LG25]